MWQVLIADDVKMNRKLLRAALSRHCCSEWEIAECATAEAAVAEMSSTSDSRYDLVLMDDHFEVNDAHDSACMHAQHRPSAHSPQIPCAPSLSQPRTSLNLECLSLYRWMAQLRRRPMHQRRVQASTARRWSRCEAQKPLPTSETLSERTRR